MNSERSVTNKCEVCGIEITGNAKTCSPRCRMALSRQKSVTSGVSVTREIEASVTFEFYTLSKANGMGRKEDEKLAIRKAKYWYDVPLAAIPVMAEGFPEMPGFMNGRQYFLWWKNDFKTEKDGQPIIISPFPVLDNVVYYKAGEGSRRYGA
jgi:hypothetical protein